MFLESRVVADRIYVWMRTTLDQGARPLALPVAVPLAPSVAVSLTPPVAVLSHHKFILATMTAVLKTVDWPIPDHIIVKDVLVAPSLIGRLQ